MEQTRMNGRERTAMMMAVTVLESMYHMEETLQKRLKAGDRNGWRDFKLAMTMQQRAIAAVRATMPDKDGQWLNRIVHHAKINIALDGPLQAKDYLLIDHKDMARIAQMSARHECSMCIRTGKEIKRCVLRSALLDCCPPPEWTTEGLCEYSCVDWERDI